MNSHPDEAVVSPTRGAGEHLPAASQRATRWTLIAFAALTLPIVILALGSTVLRALDIDVAPSEAPTTQSTADDESTDGDDETSSGSIVLVIVAALAISCVAVPLVAAHQRHRGVAAAGSGGSPSTETVAGP